MRKAKYWQSTAGFMTHFTEGCLPRTGIRSGTVRSVIEYGHLYLYFVYTRGRLSPYNLERSSDAVDKELPAVLLGVVHPGRLHLRPHRVDHVLDLVVWKQVRDLAGRQQVVDEDQEPLVGHLSDHTKRMRMRPTVTQATWSVCLCLSVSVSVCLSVRLSLAGRQQVVDVSVCLYVCLFVCLSPDANRSLMRTRNRSSATCQTTHSA